MITRKHSYRAASFIKNRFAFLDLSQEFCCTNVQTLPWSLERDREGPSGSPTLWLFRKPILPMTSISTGELVCLHCLTCRLTPWNGTKLNCVLKFSAKNPPRRIWDWTNTFSDSLIFSLTLGTASQLVKVAHCPDGHNFSIPCISASTSLSGYFQGTCPWFKRLFLCGILRDWSANI